jgi:acetyl esterase/lipase
MRPAVALSILLALQPCASGPASAQPAPATHERIALWPGGAPGSEARRGEAEIAKDYWVRNIHDPSLTVYLPPPGKANGSAVVVVPGGGHRLLVFKAEGEEPAAFLANLGVTAFALKHRLSREEGSTYSIERDARADAYRALRLVRSRAAEWRLDPRRIGIMGFSAGGEVVGLVSFGPGDGDPNAPDPIDRVNGRPDFAIFIYPGPLAVPETVPATAPPAFLLAAADDPCCAAPTVRLLQQYRDAKVPVEAHIFATGGHGFNMGQRSSLKSVGTWPARLAEWLGDYGWLGSR